MSVACNLDYNMLVSSRVVSAPDPNPNQPQRGLLPRVILEAIRAGVGLGLGPRLHPWLFQVPMILANCINGRQAFCVYMQYI